MPDIWQVRITSGIHHRSRSCTAPLAKSGASAHGSFLHISFKTYRITSQAVQCWKLRTSRLNFANCQVQLRSRPSTTEPRPRAVACYHDNYEKKSSRNNFYYGSNGASYIWLRFPHFLYSLYFFSSLRSTTERTRCTFSFYHLNCKRSATNTFFTGVTALPVFDSIFHSFYSLISTSHPACLRVTVVAKAVRISYSTSILTRAQESAICSQ